MKLDNFNNVIVIGPLRSGTRLLVRLLYSYYRHTVSKHFNIINPPQLYIRHLYKLNNIIHCHDLDYLDKSDLDNNIVIIMTRNILDSVLSRCYMDFRFEKQSNSLYHYYRVEDMKLDPGYCDLTKIDHYYETIVDFYSGILSKVKNKNHIFLNYSEISNNFNSINSLFNKNSFINHSLIPVKEIGSNSERFLNWDEVQTYVSKFETDPYKIMGI